MQQVVFARWGGLGHRYPEARTVSTEEDIHASRRSSSAASRIRQVRADLATALSRLEQFLQKKSFLPPGSAAEQQWFSIYTNVHV